MKKIILGTLLLCSAFAFSQRIQKGGAQLNAGVGFTNNWGVPIYVGVDYGVTDDITIGGKVSYATDKDHGVKGTWFSISANGNYHFNRVLNIPNNWDFYAGASLAYNNFSYKDGNGWEDSGIGFDFQIGGRYFFDKNWGLNLEFGGGDIASGGRVGITYIF